MFFVKTIRRAIFELKEKRKIQKLADESLKEYSDLGKRVYESLEMAERAIGEMAGIEWGNYETNNSYSSFGIELGYKVDERLSLKIRREYSSHTPKRVSETQVIYKITFYIDGVLIQYPNQYKELAKMALDSVIEKVSDFRHQQDVKLADYFAEAAVGKPQKKSRRGKTKEVVNG